MSSLTRQVQSIEAGLTRMQERVPDLPVVQILTSRLLVHLGRELSSRLDQRLKPHGLNDIEYRVLMSVYSYKTSAAYPGELCVSLGQSPANITRITDNLVERGLISRIPDEQDRRRLLLKITPTGELLAELLLPLMLESVRENYQAFSADDLQQMLDGLKRLAGVMDAVAERRNATPAE